MIHLNWNSILENTISGIFVVIFGGVSAWIAYTVGLKGKEKSQTASQRKQEIYIPLKYEIKNILDMPFDIWKDINIPEIDKILSKNDELVVPEDLCEKCAMIQQLVLLYRRINIYNIITNILLERFKERYLDLYGTTTHVEYMQQPDEDVEIDVEDYEIRDFYEVASDKRNIDNLMKNDIGYEEYCHEENYVSPLEEFLSRMCASVLPQGENTYRGIKLDDDSLKEKKKTPAEYIAYGFAFFSVFNNHKEISEKNELLAQIKELSLDLYEDVTIKIRSIGNKYEKE